MLKSPDFVIRMVLVSFLSFSYNSGGCSRNRTIPPALFFFFLMFLDLWMSYIGNFMYEDGYYL